MGYSPNLLAAMGYAPNLSAAANNAILIAHAYVVCILLVKRSTPVKASIVAAISLNDLMRSSVAHACCR